MNNYESVYPLTHPQKRIWFIEQQHPNTSIHHLGGLIKINGKSDLVAINQAIQLCISRNEGLRLQITEIKGEPFQKVCHPLNKEIDYVDFSTSYPDPGVACENWVKEKMAEPFTFLNHPLYYFAICKMDEHKYGYLIKLHHIISDGWTIHILTKQISDYYTQLLSGDYSLDVQVEPSYLEYIAKEQVYLNSKRYFKNRTFWRERFEKLPESSYEKVSDGIQGKRKTFELNTRLSDRLRDYAQQNRLSLNALFNALMIVYIHKMTQQSDIIIGSPVLNRSGQVERKMVGMFTSTMPFRLNVHEEDTFESLIKQANRELLACFSNQKYPFDLLVQDIELQKKGRDRLFHICVNYYNTNLINTMAGMPLENEESHSGNQLYSLQLVIKEWSDKQLFTLHYDYKTDDYHDNEIDRMHEYMLLLIKQILTDDQLKLSEVSLLSPEKEQYLVYEWNNTLIEDSQYSSIHRSFEEQAATTPDHTAIFFEEKSMTYRELNEKANQLARLLRNRHIGVDRPVGILGDHSQEIIIAMLAVLKAGGCYVPIDPEYPRDRIGYILNDANISVLLTDDSYDQQINYEGEIVNINESRIFKGDSVNLELPNHPHDLAYIIYTSGSTGKPKGVMVHHEGVMNYISWAKDQYIKSQNETFAFYSSIAFDLTVTSIFTPLLNGNSIVIYKKSTQEYILERILKENRTNIIKMTPGHLALLAQLNVDQSMIRCIIVGGEELKTNVSRQIFDTFKGQVDIYNEYGPTETVVGCMIHRYDPKSDTRVAVPIGKPIKNTQIYVLDRNLRPVPPGAQGELYISGKGVARGYLGREALTSERFVTNPFNRKLRMYKTGDLGKFLDSGTIEYLGRIDHQVKINGYRIETGEVEHYLLEHEKISNATVLPHYVEGRSYLVAYIVSNAVMSSHEINCYLSEIIPYYMLPSTYVFTDHIPLTGNGKVDRETLIEKLEENSVIEERAANDIELAIINIYKDVLNVSEMSINDHFYRMGGDSIKAIQVASKLRELNYQVKVQDIMTNPTIKQLSMSLKESGPPIIPQENMEGNIGLLPIVSWFFEQNLHNVHHFNQSIFLKMNKVMNISMLESIVQKLIQHHDALRVNYDSDSGALYYNSKHLAPKDWIYYYDLSTNDEVEQDANIQLLGSKIKASLNIEESVLFKVCLFDCGGERGSYVLMTAHHLIIDAVSWRILLEDFARLYAQLEANQSFELPRKTHSIQQWSASLNEFKNNEVTDDLVYWKEELATDFPMICTNKKNQLEHTYAKDSITTSLSIKETDILMTTGNVAYNTRPVELLIAALMQSLSSITENDKIIIEIEGHGREEIRENIDVTRTVGWFTSIYPVLFKRQHQTLEKQIVAVKEKLRNIPRKGIGYGVLRYLTSLLPDTPNKYVRFNYLGQLEQNSHDDLFEVSNSISTGEDAARENKLTALIDIVAVILKGQLQISISYSNDHFKNEEMNLFLTSFLSNLKLVIDYCNGAEIQGFTPSDFDSIDISEEELEMLFE